MTEKHYYCFKLPEGDLEIYHNPSRQEFYNLLKYSQEDDLRAFLSDDNLYIWDAYYATHEQMLNRLDFIGRNYYFVYLMRNHIIILRPHDAKPANDQIIIDHVKSNKLLKNIYISQPEINVFTPYP